MSETEPLLDPIASYSTAHDPEAPDDADVHSARPLARWRAKTARALESRVLHQTVIALVRRAACAHRQGCLTDMCADRHRCVVCARRPDVHSPLRDVSAYAHLPPSAPTSPHTAARRPRAPTRRSGCPCSPTSRSALPPRSCSSCPRRCGRSARARTTRAGPSRTRACTSSTRPSCSRRSCSRSGSTDASVSSRACSSSSGSGASSSSWAVRAPRLLLRSCVLTEQAGIAVGAGELGEETLKKLNETRAQLRDVVGALADAKQENTLLRARLVAYEQKQPSALA
jgi:hypothetical protein